MLIHQKTEFDAAHRLFNYPGNCSNIHGHTWTVEVWIEGELTDLSMVRDYREIKGYFKDEFDHKLLLWKMDPLVELLEGRTKIKKLDAIPTAEHLAAVIRGDLGAEKVRIWESKDNYAEALK